MMQRSVKAGSLDIRDRDASWAGSIDGVRQSDKIGDWLRLGLTAQILSRLRLSSRDRGTWISTKQII